MARSRIREDQVLDSDFLSEAEFAVASGILDIRITKNNLRAYNQTIAGGAGTVGKAYYLTSTDATWLESDKISEVTVSGAVGVCSDSNEIMFSGLFTSTTHGLGDTGKALYISTSGTLSATEASDNGEFIKRVGFIEDANSIRVAIDENYYELGTGFESPTTLASQAEAEAGTDDTKWMSPLKVFQAIVAKGVAIFQAISGTTALGLITTSETINATNNTEYTGNITANITLNIEGFTVSRKTVKISLDLVSASGLLTVAIAGYTFDWPPNQTQTLTDLADGSYDILLSWNSTTGKVVPRVQQVA